MTQPLVLVTGASSGIGLHLAREFAAHGHPIALVAPDAAELDACAAAIRAEFGVEALSIPADLEKSDAVDDIRTVLQSTGHEVGILVNNAGHGFRGNFVEQPLDIALSMVRLNVDAVLRVAHAFIPPMVARGQGRVLNTASIAGFQPAPTMAVYHATKAFVLSWSEAIADELSEQGVTVTALCPGATDTDFFPKAGIEDSRVFQSGNVMAPQDVAQAGYAACMAGERVIVPGAMNKAMVFSRRLLPESTQAKLNEAQYSDVEADKVKHQRGDFESEAARKAAD